jgi:hypothetical protein
MKHTSGKADQAHTTSGDTSLNKGMLTSGYSLATSHHQQLAGNGYACLDAYACNGMTTWWALYTTSDPAGAELIANGRRANSPAPAASSLVVTRAARRPGCHRSGHAGPAHPPALRCEEQERWFEHPATLLPSNPAEIPTGHPGGRATWQIQGS